MKKNLYYNLDGIKYSFREMLTIAPQARFSIAFRSIIFVCVGCMDDIFKII